MNIYAKYPKLKAIGITLATVATLLAAGGAASVSADINTASTDIFFTKTLVSPESSATVLPELEFSFNVSNGTFYNYNSDGSIGAEDSAVTAPTINSQKLKFTNDDTDNATLATDKDGQNTITKQSTDLLDDNVIAAFKTLDKAGVFKYTITEDAASSTQVSGLQSIDYDDTTYTMTIYTSNGGNIDAVIVEKDATETTPTESKKVSADEKPEIGKGSDNQSVVSGENTDGTFAFDNYFTEKAVDPGTVDPGDEATLPYFVKDTITGHLANPDDPFSYTINVLDKSNKPVIPTLVITDGTTETNVPTPAANADGSYDFTFELKDGEKAYFKDLNKGTVITATQTNKPDYVTHVTSTFNNAITRDNISLDTTQAITGTIGDIKNADEYTNDKDGTITATGVLMKNLPYLALIVTAVGGLTVAFVAKRRKHNA